MERMKKTFKFLGLFTLALIIMAFLAPSDEEKKEQLKKEISQIENTVLKIPALNVEDNLIAYTKLHEYYPKNEKYKSKYLKYKTLEEHESLCRISSRDIDQKSLLNKDSYSEVSKNLKWQNFNELLLETKFTGKNALDHKINFISKYKCSIKDKQVYLKKIYIKVGS